MISELLKSGVPSAHNNARQRVEGKVDLPRLFRAIDADPAIAGAGLVYIESDFTVVTLREFRVICSIVPKKVVLREAPRHMAPLEFVRIVETQPRESRLVAEAVSAGLACSSAILGWIAAFSGTVFVPFSAGTSLIVSKIGLAVVAASSAQCIVSGVRAYNEASDPVLNDEMDREDWYRYMMPLLDAISLLGAGISGVATVRLLQARKAATGRNWYELSRGLSRQQQKSLTRELLSIRHPSLTAKQLKLKQRLMELPKRYTNGQLQHATLTQIKDAVGAALSLAGSAHSGNIKAIAMGVLYESNDGF
ncbi:MULTISPECIES: NAD synthetase [unclassified Pseudomonas]|uniref:NAD synthetase n=1 Tax=unclassified Pseudomonas TaxID=196821 RepID=UPI00128DCF91|nr:MULTISPECIES: NAD synthetase [unclassified Pseudomonas]MPQ70703.1 NAD synthetase [Pseudomonas sp. MWU12-2323]